jgi:bifunctional DNase/RNase
MRKMEIEMLGLERQSNTPIVVLKDPESDTHLHIYIGIMEATAIASGVGQVHFPRPVIHDLLTNLFNILGVTINWVEISDIRDNTFYAFIHMSVDGKKTKIDARPSDAIAIALRMKAPIYASETLLKTSKGLETGAKEEIVEEEAKKWTEVLESFSSDHFGKYKM